MAEPDVGHSAVITDNQLIIDGQPFPWLMDGMGPRLLDQAYDEDTYEPCGRVILVPILVDTVRDERVNPEIWHV